MQTQIEAYGTTYGAGDVKINFLGRTLVGISKIKYGTKQDKKNEYAMSVDPVTRGLGRRTYEASLTLKSFEMDAISRIAPNGDITQIKPFPVVVCYFDTDENLVKTDQIAYAEFNGETRDIKGGDTEVEIECELTVGPISRNV